MTIFDVYDSTLLQLATKRKKWRILVDSTDPVARKSGLIHDGDDGQLCSLVPDKIDNGVWEAMEI